MRIAYACPACSATVMLDGIEARTVLECTACSAEVAIPDDAIGMETPATDGAASSSRLNRCLVCPSTELFVRKDFPQQLGVAIVVVGLLASCVAWAWHELIVTFAILFATAAIDVVIYLFMPDCLSCYRCGARYRGDGLRAQRGEFNLETHEKYRQQQARSRQIAGR